MDKIKNILLGLIGIGATIITALFYRQKAITADIKREAAESARETEQKATEAIVRGVTNETKVRQEIENNPVKRHDLT